MESSGPINWNIRACRWCGTKVGSCMHRTGREAYGIVSAPSPRYRSQANNEGLGPTTHKAYACRRYARAMHPSHVVSLANIKRRDCEHGTAGLAICTRSHIRGLSRVSEGEAIQVAVVLAAAQSSGRSATSPAMSSIVQSIFGSGQRTMEASQVHAWSFAILDVTAAYV